MIQTRTIEALISFIILIAAYTITGTIAGCFQAWVTKKMGDPTAEEEGYLTLNPFMHIDIVGMIFLLYLGIGWTKHIPINPYNINSTFRTICAYTSQIFMYLFLAFISLVKLELIFGLQVLNLVIPMVMAHTASLSVFSQVYAHYPSSALLLALFLVSVMYLAILLSVLDTIVTGIHILCRLYAPHILENEFLLFVITFASLVLLGGVLKVYVVQLIQFAGTFTASLLGAW